MVLVMLSSTTCLYFGAEDSLHTRYPRDENITAYFPDPSQPVRGPDASAHRRGGRRQPQRYVRRQCLGVPLRVLGDDPPGRGALPE